MSKRSIILSLPYESANLFRDILNGESITKLMIEPGPICPLIQEPEVLGKLLGKGNYGSVYTLKSDDKYAVKVSELETNYFKPDGITTYLDIQNRYNIRAETIIEYNSLRSVALPKDVVAKKLYIPVFMSGCRLKDEVRYLRVDGRGTTNFEAGEQVCPMYKSESGISIITGSLCRSGRSINFLDTFYFTACVDEKQNKVYQYTFMERVRSSLRKSIKCLYEGSMMYSSLPHAAERALNSVIIQIIHAIYIIQATYNIVHGDLHDDNVFFEFISKDTEWNGHKLIDADYYEYEINGKSIYIPGGKECPFIIKLGDWGLACKYSKPRIANDETIKTGYNLEDGNGSWLPNFYNETYDMYVIMNNIYDSNPSNTLASNIMSWILNVPPGIPDIIKNASIVTTTPRPDIRKIGSKRFYTKTPKNLLLDETIMKEYYVKPPPESKVILLGSDYGIHASNKN